MKRLRHRFPQAYDLVKAAEKYEKWLLLMGALTVLLLIWAVMAQILKMTTKKRILALMIQLFLIGAEFWRFIGFTAYFFGSGSAPARSNSCIMASKHRLTPSSCKSL